MAAGAGLLLVAWLGSRGVPSALRAHAALRDRTASQLAQLSRAREFIAEEGALRDSFAASAGRLVGLAPRLVAGATTSEATATLTSLIVAAAGRDRVRIGRIEPLPDSSSALFVRIALHVEAQGDVQGIAHWLAILEGGRPAVTIQELGLSTAEPGASADKAEVLRGTLIAVGWATLRPREQP